MPKNYKKRFENLCKKADLERVFGKTTKKYASSVISTETVDDMLQFVSNICYCVEELEAHESEYYERLEELEDDDEMIFKVGFDVLEAALEIIKNKRG